MDIRTHRTLDNQTSARQLGAFQRQLETGRPPLTEANPADEALPEYWVQRRRQRRPSDRALTGQALDWLITLPREFRPHSTVDGYPRVVNQLAEAWGQPQAIHDLLHSLLHDRRAGRKGFPAVVRRELKILRFHSVTTQPAQVAQAAAEA